MIFAKYFTSSPATLSFSFKYMLLVLFRHAIVGSSKAVESNG